MDAPTETPVIIGQTPPFRFVGGIFFAAGAFLISSAGWLFVLLVSPLETPIPLFVGLLLPLLIYSGVTYLKQGLDLWRVIYEVGSSQVVVRHGTHVTTRVAWAEVEHLTVYWPRRSVFRVAKLRRKNGSAVSLVPDPTSAHPEWIAAIVRAAEGHAHITLDVPEALPTWYPEIKNVRLRKNP